MIKNDLSIKEHVIYYMLHGDEYYDKFYVMDYRGRDNAKYELSKAYQDYITNNKRLCKCNEETKRQYKNIYSNVRHKLLEQKRNKANDFYLNFVNDPSLTNILNEYGFGICGTAIRVIDSRKALKYMLNKLIPEIEKIMNLTGIKAVKNASLLSHTLLDFSEAVINED